MQLLKSEYLSYYISMMIIIASYFPALLLLKYF